MNNVRQLFKFWQRNVDVPRRGALQPFPSFHLVEVDLLSDFSSSDFQRFLVGHPAPVSYTHLDVYKRQHQTTRWQWSAHL